MLEVRWSSGVYELPKTDADMEVLYRWTALSPLSGCDALHMCPRRSAHQGDTTALTCRDSLEPDTQAWNGRNLSAAEWWAHLDGWRYMREDTHRVIMIANNTVLFPLNKVDVMACQMPCNGHVGAQRGSQQPGRRLGLPCRRARLASLTQIGCIGWLHRALPGPLPGSAPVPPATCNLPRSWRRSTGGWSR